MIIICREGPIHKPIGPVSSVSVEVGVTELQTPSSRKFKNIRENLFLQQKPIMMCLMSLYFRSNLISFTKIGG